MLKGTSKGFEVLSPLSLSNKRVLVYVEYNEFIVYNLSFF